MRDALEAAGIRADVLVTESEEAIAATQVAIQQGYDIVAAAGGDGAIGAVACELLHSQTVLSVLPLSNVMNIARIRAIPRSGRGCAGAGTRVRRASHAGGDRQLLVERRSVRLAAAASRAAQGMNAAQGTFVRVGMEHFPGGGDVAPAVAASTEPGEHGVRTTGSHERLRCRGTPSHPPGRPSRRTPRRVSLVPPCYAAAPSPASGPPVIAVAASTTPKARNVSSANAGLPFRPVTIAESR